MTNVKPIDIEQSFATAPSKFVWKFSPEQSTFLQTDSDIKEKAHWYLTQKKTGNPAYWIEINQNSQSILDTLVHLSSKSWVDKEQLLEAMLPALRAIVWEGVKHG